MARPSAPIETQAQAPGAAPARPPDIPALTSLRFVAAFAVVLLHYRDLLGPLPPWLLKLFVGGQYGVTFFFVLSGFILTYNYLGWFEQGVDARHYGRFQRLRFARLYPVYLLGLLLDTPGHLVERAAAGALPSSWATLWAAWLLNAVGLQPWVPAVPYAMYWNTPAWSVGAEFFFYACFPWLCRGLAAHVQRAALLPWVFAAVVLGGAGLYALVLQAMNGPERVAAQTQYLVLVYNPLLRFSEFAAGCVAGLYFMRCSRGAAAAMPLATGPAWLARPRGRHLALAAALLAVLWRVMADDYVGPAFNLWLLDVSIKYAYYIVPFTLIILALASGPTVLSPVLEHPWAVRLGEASYALYILHWAGVSAIQLGLLGRASSPGLHALVMLATVGLALLVHLRFELPWRRRLRPGPA